MLTSGACASVYGWGILKGLLGLSAFIAVLFVIVLVGCLIEFRLAPFVGRKAGAVLAAADQMGAGRVFVVAGRGLGKTAPYLFVGVIAGLPVAVTTFDHLSQRNVEIYGEECIARCVARDYKDGRVSGAWEVVCDCYSALVEGTTLKMASGKCLP